MSSSEGRCANNGDWYPECPEYVAGDSCDNKTWSDGSFYWDECCDSCLALQNGSVNTEPIVDTMITSCENNMDWYANCAEMVDGRSCDNRSWRDGTPYWSECCVSCLEVQNASPGWSTVIEPEIGWPVMNGDSWTPVDPETNWVDCTSVDGCDEDQGIDNGPPDNQGGNAGNNNGGSDEPSTGNDEGNQGTIFINPGNNGADCD
jgi:hypothetical protein